MVEVREATVRDEGAILRLLAQLWRATEHYYEPSRKIDAESYYETVHRMLTSPDWTFLLADDEEKEAGLVAFLQRPSLLVAGDRAYIAAFVVAEEYRRLGVGSLIIEEAKRVAREKGCKGMAVSTEVENKDVIGFYAKLGFVKKHEYLEMDF